LAEPSQRIGREKSRRRGGEAMDLSWFYIVVTLVFAAITGYYSYETRRMRQETLRPNLSLRTGMYTLGGGIHELVLRNTGSVAKDVDIDVEKGVKGGPTTKEALFVPSLDKSQEVSLITDLDSIRRQDGFVNVSLSFKDASNRKLTETLSIDFADLTERGRKITFQTTPKD
jgi:hypothetical protein